jgi:hypothetical protein
MFAEHVLDAKGHRWTIERRFTPWYRLVRPVAYIMDKYPDLALTPPPGSAPEQPLASPPPQWSRGEKIAFAVIAAVFAPYVVGQVLMMLIAWILVWPVAALELSLVAVTGSCLELLRAVRLVRHRVDVTCWTGPRLHSETILLVRGSRRARQLVAALAAERFDAPRSFRPTALPADVTVRLHRSIWQASGEWT